LNSAAEPLKQSGDLAKEIAERAGQSYSGESLWEVLAAVRGPLLSPSQIETVLQRNFANCKASKEIDDLLTFTWRRIYTWNIDDVLDNARRGVQRRRYFNGLADKAREFESLSIVDVVRLHGEIAKPEHGFVLTEQDYNIQLASGKHEWYRRAAQDYINYTPIFIGSKLKEPILSMELDRARRSAGSELGRAYLVSPDRPTPIQQNALRARQIVHVEGTLGDFVRWLQQEFGGRLSPEQAAANGNQFAGVVAGKVSVTSDDIETARSIFPINREHLRARLQGMTDAAHHQLARAYLRGFPPTWEVAASDIPVWLSNTTSLFHALKAAVERRDRLFMTYGQSGSGKTTALMQALLRLQREQPSLKIYDFRSDLRSTRAALGLLERLHKGEQVVVFAGDAFLYGDALANDIQSTQSGQFTVVSSARTGEWREHLERHLGELCVPFEYQRFLRADYQPLIDRLLEFVPAPAFRRLDAGERIRKMSQSRSQLLIALREATESAAFTDVITHEFEGLPSDDARLVAVIVGIATIARVGVAPGTVREVFAKLRPTADFDEVLKPLDGIVLALPNGRMFARHELYVRHIVENVADLELILSALTEILRTYNKYEAPVVRSVMRTDATLFKFIMNHNFIKEVARGRGRAAEGLRVYSEFEVDFQLDGHYWLQYGQYLKELGQFDEALIMLQRSIRAYPDNPYAVHAFAEVQLAVARRRPSYDAVTVQLIGEAVKTLLELDSTPGSEWDLYPIVTLAQEHVGTLRKHGQMEPARRAASQYFERLQLLERRISAVPLLRAKERMLQFAATGEWYEESKGQPRRSRRRGRG
jgi:tetratricopeptide (TPR) repeat protein